MTLIFMGYHAPTVENEKVVVPASCVTITLENGTDCLGESYIATMKQQYARPNKKFDGFISVDMFNGKKGIEDLFYSYEEILECINSLHDDGYKIKRITRNAENETADILFKSHMRHCMKNANFVLPK